MPVRRRTGIGAPREVARCPDYGWQVQSSGADASVKLLLRTAASAKSAPAINLPMDDVVW